MNAQEQRFWDQAVISFAAALLPQSATNIMAPIDCIRSAAELADTAIQERKKRLKQLPEGDEMEEEDSNGFNPTEEQRKNFKNFQIWMQKETPAVCKLPVKITIFQYLKLRGEYPDGNGGYIPGLTKKQVTDTLQSIENNKQYLKKYRSPYLCVKNWNKE